MEELTELLDIFIYLQDRLNRNLELAGKISRSQDTADYKRTEYEKAKEIDDLILREAFIREHAKKMAEAGLRKYARILVAGYNELCKFTRDTSTISLRFTKKREPILDMDYD